MVHKNHENVGKQRAMYKKEGRPCNWRGKRKTPGVLHPDRWQKTKTMEKSTTPIKGTGSAKTENKSKNSTNSNGKLPK